MSTRPPSSPPRLPAPPALDLLGIHRADNMGRDHHLGVTSGDWARATTGPACTDATFLASLACLCTSGPGSLGRQVRATGWDMSC